MEVMQCLARRHHGLSLHVHELGIHDAREEAVDAGKEIIDFFREWLKESVVDEG